VEVSSSVPAIELANREYSSAAHILSYKGFGIMDERTRHLLLTLRAALLMALGAVEDALGLPRTLPSRKERRAERASLPIIDG
jgi:hypothetical protein